MMTLPSYKPGPKVFHGLLPGEECEVKGRCWRFVKREVDMANVEQLRHKKGNVRAKWDLISKTKPFIVKRVA